MLENEIDLLGNIMNKKDNTDISIEKQLKDFDIYVDFENGDKFYLKNFEIDKENKKIIFKASKYQLNWIKIDILYPINCFKKYFKK